MCQVWLLAGWLFPDYVPFSCADLPWFLVIGTLFWLIFARGADGCAASDQTMAFDVAEPAHHFVPWQWPIQPHFFTLWQDSESCGRWAFRERHAPGLATKVPESLLLVVSPWSVSPHLVTLSVPPWTPHARCMSRHSPTWRKAQFCTIDYADSIKYTALCYFTLQVCRWPHPTGFLPSNYCERFLNDLVQQEPTSQCCK